MDCIREITELTFACNRPKMGYEGAAPCQIKSSPGNALWFACQGDEALGNLGNNPASQDACTIIRDPGTASIVKAYTLPAARGRGVGAALLNYALAWAGEQGYQRCSVDYEAANPPAAFGGVISSRWFSPSCAW